MKVGSLASGAVGRLLTSESDELNVAPKQPQHPDPPEPPDALGATAGEPQIVAIVPITGTNARRVLHSGLLVWLMDVLR